MKNQKKVVFLTLSGIQLFMRKNKSKILYNNDRSKYKEKKKSYNLIKAPIDYDISNNKCCIHICEPYVNIYKIITDNEYIILNYNCGCREDDSGYIHFENSQRYSINLRDIFYTIDKNTRTKYR